MSQLVTHRELRTRVMMRGGWERESSRHTPGTIARELSLSAMDLQDQMLRAGLTDLFLTSTTITTVSGTSTYALTNGFYELIGLDINTGAGTRFALERFMERERPNLLNTTVSRVGYPQFYAPIGMGSVELLPVPAGVYTITVRYVPPQPPLVADDDTFDGLNGLEEWMVCDVVRKLAASEKDWPTVQAMDAMCLRLGDRITTMARMRDRASPRRVVDVRCGRGARGRRP